MTSKGRYAGRFSQRLDGKLPPQRPVEVPPGHSAPAHVILGFCAACRGMIIGDELAMWREFAKQYLDELRVLSAGPGGE